MAPDVSGQATPPGRSDDLLGIVVVFALLIGLAHRLVVGWGAPVWLDETYTGAIAAQPDFRSLIGWCLRELSGPVYYVPMWLWCRIAGTGDFALRLPSLICSLLAPLLILRWGHPDRAVRWTWAAIAACWLPGIMFACEARPYALLFLLCTGQAIAFLRLLDAPTTRRAMLWTAISAVAICTHYHAAVISGVQGLLFLGLHRGRAVRCWPAILPLIPMAIWARYQLPVVLAFASPNVAWYVTLPPGAVKLLPAFLLGPEELANALAAVIVAGIVWQGWRRARGNPLPYSVPETLVVSSGLIAIAIVFGLAFVRPSFVPRYLIPYMPAALLGLALWARAMNLAYARAATALIACMAGLTMASLIEKYAHPELDHRWTFNLEIPSAWLRANGAERLVFLWESQTPQREDTPYLAQVGGFFFHRAGDRTPVTVAWPGPDEDPNTLLTRLAGPAPGGAILWAFDRYVPHTRGALHPPRIARIDPTWRCRDFGRDSVTVLACVRPKAR